MGVALAFTLLHRISLLDGRIPTKTVHAGALTADKKFARGRWLSESEADQIEERMSGWISGLGNAREALSKK